MNNLHKLEHLLENSIKDITESENEQIKNEICEVYFRRYKRYLKRVKSIYKRYVIIQLMEYLEIKDTFDYINYSIDLLEMINKTFRVSTEIRLMGGVGDG